MRAIRFDGWGGRRYEAVDVIGETNARLRCKILGDRVRLAGRNRWAIRGDVVLIPRSSVVEISNAEYEKSKQ